ncbi:aspartate aminotransferase family protein [Streptomyces sp. NPDC059255]|uniref:aspartate aminotransferase family protein n=1 Tax=Streptomyces sp. NPDC059255 TaxID=3346793 RepID=UPI0036C5887F
MTDHIADPARGVEVLAMDRRHVFHSWSAQKKIRPLAVARAEGSWFWDFDGKRYLDFSSQMVNTNIGHQHPRVTAAIAEQAVKLSTVAPEHANEVRGEAAGRIAELAPEDMHKVFFANSGSEANENAIRMARIHTGRSKVLSFYRSFHGNTAVSAASTGDNRRWSNEYATGHVHFFGPYLFRSAFWANSEGEECARALHHLEQVIQMENPSSIAAVLMESIVGTAGVLVPPPGYLAGVRKLCDKYGIIYIADEVMCGFGRAGSWFAFEQHGVVPDLITFAKGANSGYVPISGVIISDKIAATFDDQVFPGGMTYSGHPLACASVVATIDAMKDERILENAVSVGNEVFGPGLRELARRHPVIGEVRGQAVFWGMDLVSNPETREPLVPFGASSEPMARYKTECLARGLMPSFRNSWIRVVPPCTISEAEAKEGLEILDDVLAVMDKYCGA